jgi:hypothetical protein
MNQPLLLPTARFLQHSQRITLYPDLVTERRFWLQLYSIDRCVASLYFYTLSGMLIFKAFLAHKEHFSTHTIWLPAQVSTGIYKIAVYCGEHHYLKTIIIR